MGEDEQEGQALDEQHDEQHDTDVGESQVEGDGGDESGEVETVVQLGEAPPASEAGERESTRFADLRKRYREATDRSRKLEEELQALRPAAAAPKLPERPTLAECEYDEKRYQDAMDGWYAKKREVDAHEAKQADEARIQRERVQAIETNYATSKAALKVSDFEEAEQEVGAIFDPVQRGIVLAAADNPAAVVYVLHKNPERLRKLAEVKDPAKFAAAIGKLETEVKVTQKRTGVKPPPETTLRSGSTSAATSASAELDKLRAEADRTGDRSKVIAYMARQQRA